MGKPRLYLKPGSELDCGYFSGPHEYVRGFLRLPDSTDSGRLRLVEDVPSFKSSADLLDPIPLFLFDGSTGTPACVLDSFVTSHRMSMPTPPPFPLELLVNQVIVGSDDAGQKYERATVRSEGLTDFLEVLTLTPERVAKAGATAEVRASAVGDGWGVTLAESAEMDTDKTSVVMQWYGDLTLEAEARPLQDWGRALGEILPLFAFLADKPLAPNQMYAEDGSNRIDLYASWPERSAPTRTVPLATLRRLENHFDEVVQGWLRLGEEAHDFLDHVAEFQWYRQRHTLPDQVLLLFRCLELYHSFCDRFSSRVRSKSENKALVRAVLEGMPKELRGQHESWIKPTISEANRKRLVALVEDILADLGPGIVERCYIADPASFASAAKRTRNHYTHPTGRPPKEVPEGRELFIFVQRLWFLVRACVLVELGISRDEVAAALARSAQRHYLLK